MEPDKKHATTQTTGSPWVLVENDKSLDGLSRMMQQVTQSQQESALALQRILSGMSDKMDKMNQQLRSLNERLATLENQLMEKTIREQNRRIRTHDAFSFQPRKMANP